MDSQINKKAFGIHFQKVGDVELLKVFGYMAYKRAGRAVSVLGIVFKPFWMA